MAVRQLLWVPRYLGSYVRGAPTPVTDVSSCFAAASSLPQRRASCPGRQVSRLLPTDGASQPTACGAATQLQSTTYRLPLTSKLQTIAHPTSFSPLAGANPQPVLRIKSHIAIRRSCDSLYPIRRPSLAHLPSRANEPAIPQPNHTDLYVTGHHDGMVVFLSVVRSGRAGQ